MHKHSENGARELDVIDATAYKARPLGGVGVYIVACQRLHVNQGFFFNRLCGCLKEVLEKGF